MHVADRPATVFPSASSRPREASRRACAALSLSLLVSILAACTDRAGPVAESPSVAVVDGATARPLPPTTAPDVHFRTLSGETLALREADGPVLVNFWSTSCAACLAEMPELARLRAEHAPRGFELVAVAMPHDRPDTVLELAEARGWPFPVALDIDGAVLAAFEPVPGTPTSFLIAADGTVLERHVGPADIEALGRTLDALLETASASPDGTGGDGRRAPDTGAMEDSAANRVETPSRHGTARLVGSRPEAAPTGAASRA